jgi:Transcriptional Coactivator p15 (PC4)
MAKQIEDWEQEVAEFSKNGNSKVVLKVGCYRQKPFVDLRTYFQPDDEEEYKMTKKGVRLHAESIPALIQALQNGDGKLDQFYGNETSSGKSSKKKRS